MESKSVEYGFLSGSIWQSSISTAVFFLLASLPLILDKTSWYNVIAVFVASVPCYFFCYLGVQSGKEYIRNPYVGGYLGGLLAVVFFILLLVGLFFLLLNMTK